MARWRYYWRFRRAFSNKMSPYSKNYCDFQRFLLFRKKARNAGRFRKNAGMREISQNAGFPARLRDGWHLWDCSEADRCVSYAYIMLWNMLLAFGMSLRVNLFKSQAVGDIWPPQICPIFFLVEGLWIDRRIPNFQVPRPNGFFSREFRKIKFLGRNFNY